MMKNPKSKDYEYEIYNCFDEGVILVKTEQQARSLTDTLSKTYKSLFSYKNINKTLENITL